MYVIKQKNKYLNVDKKCWVDTIEDATKFDDYDMALYYDMQHLESEIIRINIYCKTNKNT